MAIFHFQNGRQIPPWFLKFKFFSGPQISEGQCASVYQITYTDDYGIKNNRPVKRNIKQHLVAKYHIRSEMDQTEEPMQV